MATTANLPLSGQRALVTGGARGIGLATVAALAELGAEVTFTARSEASRNEAMQALQLPAQCVICDITDTSRLADITSAGFDILINNAGQIGPIGRILDVEIDAYSANIETNLIAQFAAIRLCLPHMIAKGRGTVVNISSGAAHRPAEGWAAYCSGKAGLAMLTRSLHLEYADQGIRSFGFAPGVVDTGMQVQIRASGINHVSQIPRSALAPASEPGRAIAWLCTDAANPRIGQELDIRQPDLRAEIGLPAL